MNNYVHIGKIVATFGVDGTIILTHVLGKKVQLKNIEAIFIEMIKGKQLPYFVTESKAKSNDEIFVKLEGINSKEAAHKFISRQVWLTDEDFRKLAGKQSAIAMLGYSIINQGENIGIVTEVIEQPHQILLTIIYRGNEAYIPLHEASLQQLDHKKKEIHVVLPDGLLELYS